MKFNLLQKRKKIVINHEGAPAFRVSPEMELYTAVVSTTLSDNFYEKGVNRLERIRTLITQNKPEYVAKLAVYTRKEMNLRSIPLVLCVELAKNHSGNNAVSSAVVNCVQRADEITELLAYYQLANERTGQKKLGKLSKQIQKGLGQAFNRFDEYQFAKYNREGEIRLRDALFLVHPKPKDVMQESLFNKIAKNELETPYTWETELSALGQLKFDSPELRADAFKLKWEELIYSGKLGYMALLRNLRNIVMHNVSVAHLNKVAQRLQDPIEVERSKQLPFRFLSAYRELQKLNISAIPQILQALEKAVTNCAKSIAGFDENTRILLACDVSGSMQKNINPNSTVQYFDIGLVLAMTLQNCCKRVVTGMFGDTWKIIQVPADGILRNAMEFHRREGEVGYATNGHKVIDDLINRKEQMDRVMIFTDCQIWNNVENGANIQKSWNAYHALFPQARLYLFDLAGYGTVPIQLKEKNVHLIAGWSDKIFDVMQNLEKGSGVIEKINQYHL
jgi:60 kDa SS-A/Ro ribonucleoprotein